MSAPSLQEIPQCGGGGATAAVGAPVSQSSHVTVVVPDADVRETDVLTGRGAFVDRFSGNVRFRLLIKSKKKAYSDCRHHFDKTIVARQVIQAVLDSNGRFLKHGTAVATAGPSSTVATPYRQTVWMLMEDAAILEKIKQAFRDCAKEKPKRKVSEEKRATRSGWKKSPQPCDSDRKHSPRESKSLHTTEQDLVQDLVPPPMVPNTRETLPMRTRRISPDHLFDPQLLAAKLRELQNSTVPLPEPLAPPPSAHANDNNAGPMEATVHVGSEGGPWFTAAVAPSQIPLVPPPPPLPTYNTTWTMSDSYPPLQLSPPPLVALDPPGTAAAATGQSPSVPQPIAVSWREIPDGFLLVLLGPSSRDHWTLPFTSADLDLLQRVRIQAESDGDVLCLAKIRAVLQAVMQLPPSRLQLTPSELHALLLNEVVLGGEGAFGSIF
jgi:hypothetical protein